jgi:hypothetical protein
MNELRGSARHRDRATAMTSIAPVDRRRCRADANGSGATAPAGHEDCRSAHYRR